MDYHVQNSARCRFLVESCGINTYNKIFNFICGEGNRFGKPINETRWLIDCLNGVFIREDSVEIINTRKKDKLKYIDANFGETIISFNHSGEFLNLRNKNFLFDFRFNPERKNILCSGDKQVYDCAQKTISFYEWSIGSYQVHHPQEELVSSYKHPIEMTYLDDIYAEEHFKVLCYGVGADVVVDYSKSYDFKNSFTSHKFKGNLYKRVN